MANRRLSEKELVELFRPLMAEIVKKIEVLSGSDRELKFALNRKLAKELTYLERGKPMDRKKLKALKRKQQGNQCPSCQKALPEKYAVLDRRRAIDGYTAENTELICPDCDSKRQQERGYSDAG